MRTKGIDVYHGDSCVNWLSVFNEGYRFAFIKATQAADFEDPRYHANIDTARAAGLYCGSYHFFTPDGNGTAQAQWFLRHLRNPVGQLAPVLDVERIGSMSKRQHTDSVKAWLHVVGKALGIKPIIYANRDYLQNALFPEFPDHIIWYASPRPSLLWPSAPKGWRLPHFWQYDWYGTVRGVARKGGVDLNYFRGAPQDLEKLLIR